MADAIKYTDIYLYSDGESESLQMQKFLDDNDIKYIELTYREETGQQSCLAAICTWFENSDGSKVEFTKFPFIIWESLYWEAADKSEKMQKRSFSKSIDGLPGNFVALSEKK